MTIKEAYITMKVYWSTENPKTPEQVKELFERLTNAIGIGPFRIFITSVGGIKER